MNKILVIEDDVQTRNNLATILKMEGYEALTAPNGRLGVELARKELPSLILCDISMPEMDGYAVVQALRADSQTQALPFIFLTAKGERQDHRAGMSLGADDYLSKPCSVTELLSAITARLKRREQQLKAQQAMEFRPDFSSSAPLEKLGLTPREAEVLLWVAQGKTNLDIATILGAAESTVKKHLHAILEKLGVENRSAATLRAIEVLSKPVTKE